MAVSLLRGNEATPARSVIADAEGALGGLGTGGGGGGGKAKAAGLLTSGGTESILICVLAYRELGGFRATSLPHYLFASTISRLLARTLARSHAQTHKRTNARIPHTPRTPRTPARARGIGLLGSSSGPAEIVACNTAHPAIHKACHYFGLRLVIVAPEAATQRLTPAQVQPALTSRTVAVYASAPTFPHGVVDDVTGLGRLCSRRGLGLHVDNCLGGVWLSFENKNRARRVRRARGVGGSTARATPRGKGRGKGRGAVTSSAAAATATGKNAAPIPFDFSVPGVSSMSMDVHKYGMASKGVSVAVLAPPALRALSFVPVIGKEVYITPTLQGSRGGGMAAQAWATLQFFGEEGYSREAASLSRALRLAEAGVNKIPGLRTLVSPDVCIVPVGAAVEGETRTRVDIFVLSSLMEKRGWNLFTSADPDCLAMCLGQQHAARGAALIKTWLRDLE